MENPVQDPTPPLLSLPNELLFTIADLCSLADIVSIVRCNTELHRRLYDFLIETEVKSNGAKTLIWAVFHGHLGLVKVLHHHGVSITKRWGHELGPENTGSIFSSNLAAKYLESCEPDEKGLMATSFSLLHFAAIHGHDHVILWLLEQGLSVQDESRGIVPCRDTDHPWQCQSLDHPRLWTALELALCRERVSSVMLLIEHGAAEGNEHAELPGSSALSIAIQHGCLDVVRHLLESGKYNVNATDEHGQLPLNLAASITPFRFGDEILRLVLQAGADLAIATPYQADALAFSGMPVLPLHQAIMGGHHDAAMTMVEAGAQVNTESAGYYPLHCLFRADNVECGGVLLSGRLRAKWRASRLWLLVTLLLKGADPNARTGGPTVLAEFTTGVTPLMFAASDASCPAGIEVLLQHGADVNAVDHNGENALQWLIAPPIFTYGYIRNLVRSRGHDANASTVTKVLVGSGCNVHHEDALGLSCVERFARFDRKTAALEALLDALGGELVHCRVAEALRASLAAGHFNNARLLFDYGVRIDEVQVSQEDMISIAVEYSEANVGGYPRDVMEFLHRMHRFSREFGILGDELADVLKQRFRQALAAGYK